MRQILHNRRFELHQHHQETTDGEMLSSFWPNVLFAMLVMHSEPNGFSFAILSLLLDSRPRHSGQMALFWNGQLCRKRIHTDLSEIWLLLFFPRFFSVLSNKFVGCLFLDLGKITPRVDGHTFFLRKVVDPVWDSMSLEHQMVPISSLVDSYVFKGCRPST